MISNMYLRTMSRYNQWQNYEIFHAASSLTDQERKLDRAAFWGSIQGTLSHLYWGDQNWLSRFDLIDPPGTPLKQSAGYIETWCELVEKRQSLDDLIVEWADGFAVGPVQGSLKWFSGAAGRQVEAPVSVLLSHIFNHQTHHRGQAHALITAAGGIAFDTDLFLMPPGLVAEPMNVQIVTDGPASYRAALTILGCVDRHKPGRLRDNNLAENAHLPIRRRERKMQRFKSQGQAQRFVSTHRPVYNTFSVQRHRIS